ncbi:hypothetical protein [Clostridium sardiniense]|uniref:hypothetical protein n=1 Tax=Clostridium sardiniense TaxID=29369 RepID=UPI003D33A26D
MGDNGKWFKYLGFGIIFGAIFEVLGLGLSAGVVGALCVLLLDNIYADKKCKNNPQE